MINNKFKKIKKKKYNKVSFKYIMINYKSNIINNKNYKILLIFQIKNNFQKI